MLKSSKMLKNKTASSNQNSQNEFQPLFFKALSERGIENYEKAVETLEKLIKISR